MMKIKLQLLMVLISSVVLLTACEKNAPLNNNGVALNNCSPRNIDPYICFDSLITDSRCPKDVDCVWQGTAIIKVTFHEAGNVHSFKMSMKGFPPIGYPSDTIINKSRIVFTDLTPYPESIVSTQPIVRPVAYFEITR